MDELIAIIFAILVFIGPFLLRLLGALFEQDSSPKQRAQSGAEVKSRPTGDGYDDRLRRRRARQELQQPVDAIVVDQPLSPAALVNAPVLQQDAYFNQKQANADAIQLRDDQMDSHLHEVFDRSLGSLDGGSSSQVQENVLGTEMLAALPTESMAEGIAAMLQNPTDLRKAFIVGEIMQRPSSLDSGRSTVTSAPQAR